MKILAIETSSMACSVALSLDDEVTALHEVTPMQQARNILPMISSLLASKNIKLKQLDAVAFGCGPGSFTGIRIAASVAQGLGYACQLPIISISSLGALAQTAYKEYEWSSQMVAVDARIQEVYYAAYKVNDQGLMTLVGEEKVGAPAEINPPSEFYGVGNAWEVYEIPSKSRALRLDTKILPQAEAILLLAKEKYRKKDFLLPYDALPIYLRNQVAKKINKK